MMASLLIAIGGALGSLARYWINIAIVARTGEVFPWGTVLINISGSFLIGLLASLTGPEGRWAVSPEFRLFMLVGFCGGYTTFSSFSLQTLALFEAGDPIRAGANVLLSVTLCLIAVWLGYSGPAALSRIIRS